MDVRALQRELNFFTAKYLEGVAPLHVDGKAGAATRRRIKWVKYYLGYAGGAGAQNTTVDLAFRARLWHPKSPRYSTPARIRRGNSRRVAERKRARTNAQVAVRTIGVGTFDGRTVAAWMIPYLLWARAHGWRGTLVSGFRDPAYSESLCYRMCGRPSCPGTCAGRNSNHSGSVRPRGAIDVSDYLTFAALMRRCPLLPHIFNNLPRDRVHFSATGN